MVSGLGISLVNPPLASTAVGVVPPQQAGMASGINSTFRQVGIATGIALRSPARRTMGALRDLDGRRRVERAEFVGIADRHAAHHTVVIDGVLTEPPQRG